MADDAFLRDGTWSPAALEMRQKIVDTANRLFHVYGYQKTTVADIARELGMSPANVYRFFASKTALTKAVTKLVTDEFQRNIEDVAARRDIAPPERLRLIARSHFELMRERYAVNRKIHDLIEAAMDEAWDEIEMHKADMRRVMAQVIEEGISNGDFPEQDVATAAMLMQYSLIVFFHPVLVSQAQRCMTDEQQEAMFDPMVDFALAALRNGSYRSMPEA
ncbi:TetR/AcrR family transcriptional regulator [Stappia sp. F7233]|uniref:TetR/AcrR family transcriptional regulator n=1 Tax=Stappia albiluteola TaxID=2758565 RepID=A0A839AFL7_9HYPH|nr:TetR/AcrR family transcriptional regulator [Stappia albiluteola]MBA5777734.1 TetR/AcrR family transcriptional regulator [Stappia albiluteola]